METHCSDVYRALFRLQRLLITWECGAEGRTQVNRRNGIAAHTFLEDAHVTKGMPMNDSLCKIHIKICPARIVMYSQRHVC